jgi:hypothetical protein
MENINPDKSLFDIRFDENVKQNLKAAAAWGGIAAIASLVRSILGLVSYFVEKGKINRYSAGNREVQLAANAGGLISVAISLCIGIALFVFLNKFSRMSKSGVDAGDPHFINEGLGSLSTYFKFIGVLLIIMIVLVGLGMLIAIGQNV